MVLFFTRQAYQLNIEDTEQPLLIHRPKKKTGGDLRKVNMCVCVRACARACVHACMQVCYC